MRKNKLLIKLFSTALILAGTTAYAALDKQSYVGVLAGTNLGNVGYSNSTTKADLNLGLNAGAKVIPELGLGFYGTYFGQNNSGSVLGINTERATRTWYLAAEINLFASIFHVGADLGLGINTRSSEFGSISSSSSNTAFIYGPEAGFDIPLGKTQVSLGGEVHYILTTEDEGRNNLQLFGSVKVWL